MKNTYKINALLVEHHIYPNKKGFTYICYILNNIDCAVLGKISYAYGLVAKEYNVSVDSVEKSISNAIERSFSYIDISEKYGDNIKAGKGKLTNKNFLIELATRLNNDR